MTQEKQERQPSLLQWKMLLWDHPSDICSRTMKILRSMIKVNCVDGKPNCRLIFHLIWPFSQLPLPQITRQPPTRKSKAANMFFFPDGASQCIFKNLMLMLHHRAQKTLKDRNLKAINLFHVYELIDWFLSL